ncbi:hypothetical protein L6258_02390 [Candidatus Parcubacteria bacterium]|nr:hypothetical protein [Candidatus Parcubacteria bacterium]
MEVARRKLVVLADKVGKERGRTILRDLAESRGSRFPPSVRDRVICQLVASDRVTLEEIAGAFGITRQRVSQVAAEHGVAVVRRRNFWAQVEEHLEYLATPKGRREVDAAMARVARERRFWALKRGGLGRFQTASVAEGLGFPMGGGARLRTR